MSIVVKGDNRAEGNRYIYRCDNVINYVADSIIEVSENIVTIKADILGFNKIYFTIERDGLVISNRFKDFYDRSPDRNVIPLQISPGFIPYPFTVLQGVMKAPPGITVKLTENKTSGGWTVDYHANDLLHIFQRSGHYDIKNFKYDFIQIIDNLKRACRRDIIVSLSGGFDSTLLCHLFKERIVGVVSYVDDAAQLRDLQSRMQDIIPRVPWCIFSPQEEVDKKELEAYFDSIDEPCCDVAGLADFLMIRKLAASGVDVEKMCILNGEGADNLFMRHREFFKEHILEKAFFGAHLGLILNKKITYYSIAGKIIDYFKSTKTRFYDDYTEHYSLEDFYSSKISRVYNLYDNSLNVGRTDFYNAVDFMLFCSNQATAKLKTTSDGLNVKYLLPFYDSDMIKLAFSINAKYKTGYRLGKVILRKTFKEVNNIACESGSPWHVNMWRKVSGKDTPPGFRKYYYDKWILRKTKDSVNVCK